MSETPTSTVTQAATHLKTGLQSEIATDAASIRQGIEETIGDAPEMMKLAVQQLMSHPDPAQAGNAGSAGRKGLQSGKISELTVIAQVRPGGASRLRRIFALVRGNFSGAQKVGSLHDMRFVFFDDDTRILFATTYDGDWEAYIDDFASLIPDLMDLLFSSIEGWPGIKNPSVKDFIAARQVTAAGWYVAHPRVTVSDICRFKKIDGALTDFLDRIT